MVLKILFFVIGYLVIGTLVTGWLSWYTDTDFDTYDAIEIIILIAIWPITVISGILAVFAGFALLIADRLLLIADRLKNKKS